MSNFKWVCFDCRTAVRRHAWAKDVRCPSCARQCTNIGTKTPLPPKARPQDWETLRTRHFDRKRQQALRNERERVAARHALERQIRDQEAKPSTRERAQFLRQLRVRLERMSAEAGVQA